MLLPGVPCWVQGLLGVVCQVYPKRRDYEFRGDAAATASVAARVDPLDGGEGLRLHDLMSRKERHSAGGVGRTGAGQ